MVYVNCRLLVFACNVLIATLYAYYFLSLLYSIVNPVADRLSRLSTFFAVEL